MRRCVVNFARDGWYPAGQHRLGLICRELGVDFLGYTAYPAGCPRHQDVPYAFKPYSMRSAIVAGYSSVLWMDASAVPQKPLGPVFDLMESEGAFVSANYGIPTGRWASDLCLKTMGVTRAEAWEIPHCSALVFGVCVEHPTGAALFSEYLRRAQQGDAFRGPWSYAPDQAPAPGVEGHRHDQTVLSIVAHRMGVPLRPNGPWLDYGRDKPDAVVAAYPV